MIDEKHIAEQQEFRETAARFADGAFPSVCELPYTTKPGVAFKFTTKGMSKREYYAAIFLQALLSNASGVAEPGHWTKIAVQYADSLIAELNKEKTDG